MVVYKSYPTPYWWPLLRRYSVDSCVIGSKGSKGVISFPSKHGFQADKRGLKFDLIAVRLQFDGNCSGLESI